MRGSAPSSHTAVGDLRNVIADQPGVFADGATEVLDIDAEGADVVGAEDFVAARVIGTRSNQTIDVP